VNIPVPDILQKGCEDVVEMWAKKIQQFLEIAETLQKSVPLWRDNLGAILGEMAQIAEVALEPAFEQEWCTNH
jgi:hypothetical protein